MSVQVLVAAVNADKMDLCEKLNLSTDAIVGNQCDKNEIVSFDYRGHTVRWLSFHERGVGLNRNNCLMRASADYCLFADDDMRYVDGYEALVENAFRENPEADVIAFNLIEKQPKRFVIPSRMKVNRLNFLRYGTARIAIRLKPVRDNAIYFNLCFGGGTEHRHGEDNLFLNECLNKKLHIIALPVTIAELTEERSSSWNVGYDKKHFNDQGVLYHTLSRRYYKLLCLQDAIRHRGEYTDYGNWMKVYKEMLYGVKGIARK